MLKNIVKSFPAFTTPRAAFGGAISKSPKVIWLDPCKIKAPLLEADQTICILGESSVIGAWDSSKAKPLNKIHGEQFFEIALDVQKSKKNVLENNKFFS